MVSLAGLEALTEALIDDCTRCSCLSFEGQVAVGRGFVAIVFRRRAVSTMTVRPDRANPDWESRIESSISSTFLNVRKSLS